ncbi:MAG: iron chelate uptake ABC transporter family permease subunit, partial [bacterium]
MAAMRSDSDPRARRVLAALALAGAADPVAVSVLQVRPPRALSAFAVGALLGLSGAILQALLRNPLADPYVLGVSGGAGVGALAALSSGAAAWAAPAALSGAVAALTLLAVVSVAGGGGLSRVLLAGVVIATGCGALSSLLLALAPEPALRGMV